MQLCDSGLLAAVNPAAVFGDAANQRRLDELLEQRHLAVLARSIDLQELMAGRLQKLFQRNADYLISSFQSSNVTSVVELESRVSHLDFLGLVGASMAGTRAIHIIALKPAIVCTPQVAVLRKAHQILDEKIPLRPWSFFWEQVDLPGSDAQDEEAFKSKVCKLSMLDAKPQRREPPGSRQGPLQALHAGYKA